MQRIFYFHVPKTAGSTFTNVLDSHFNKTIHHIEGIEKIDAKFLNDFDAVSGHVTYNTIDSILNLKQWFTIATFREPYSHIVSHLSWVRKLADEGEEKRFNQHPEIFQDLALKMKSLDLSNSSSIQQLLDYLEKANFHYFFNTQTLYMDNNRDLDAANSNLERINLVGLTEEMDGFYKSLFSSLGIVEHIKKIKSLNKNPNKYGLDITDEKTRSALYPFVNKDLYLYDKAVKLANT